MNVREVRKIAGRVQRVVRNTAIVENYPCAEIAPHIRELSDYTANQYSGTDVSSDDVFSYVYFKLMEFVRAILKEVKGEVADGTLLVNLVEHRLIEKIESEILEHLTSAPQSYKVRILLQSEIREPIACWRLTESLYLEVTEDNKSPIRLFNEAALNLYLVMDTRGFYSPRSECSLAQKCIQLIKTFLYSAWVLHDETFNLEFRNRPSNRSTFDKVVILNRYLEIIEPSGDCSLPIRVPSELASFITGFALRRPLEELELPSLSSIAHDPSPEAERIRAAIEWYIDSVVSDTETVKFIQLCVGLESLLGDDLGDVPLSKTLADRCAYLVSDTIRQRSVIRDKFKVMYKARSKVIHGTSRNMTDKERENLVFARTMLSTCIAKEIEHLGVPQ
ncbi:hypothetical protein FM042_09215 [Aliidiomarina halalkaliphila]|uniref:Uncharacterized protein n=1 Tax=Aliidiomarina halalkaliphila TaxID=2593535 RepID=A0A552X0E9_9GAMM|nr:HEPN domain-containing protein [Aliidiomarina halalkaliphila]TRW48349.1 hypothetical protein FM042_09215 [Aliidiomarina halalkaliphila]